MYTAFDLCSIVIDIFLHTNLTSVSFVQVILTPTAVSPKTSEWYTLQTTKACPDKSLKIKIAVRIDKPQNMKHCGYVVKTQLNLPDACVCSSFN